MFLHPAPASPQADELARSDIADDGFVMNATRLWSWRPDIGAAFPRLRRELMEGSSLTPRELFLVVSATVSAFEDPYCSLAFGTRFASRADGQTAGAVLRGETPPELTARERALAQWARKVVADPNATRQEDVDRLRAAGLGDREIFEATVLIGFRMAFSTVNSALGAQADWQLAQAAPPDVLEAARGYGRPISHPPAGGQA